MNNTVVRVYVEYVLDEIRLHRNDHDKCMEQIITGADALNFFYGESAVDELIAALASDDEDMFILSMTFLGMLSVCGVTKAHTAIKPISDRVTIGSPDMIRLITYAVLSMLGEPRSVQGREKFRGNQGLSIKEYNSQALATIVTYLRGVRD